jgi:hypothetical protein
MLCKQRRHGVHTVNTIVASHPLTA